VKMSLSFFMKSLLKYGSSVISIIGLIISLNKIFNILGGRFYKHPKEYLLHPGQNISSETIAPIFFVQKEKQECNLIIKHLEKFISNELQIKSISRSKLFNYFTIDSSGKSILDKPKLINRIQTVVSNLPPKNIKELSYYCSTQNSRKPLINQLIIDQLTLWQLDSDKETKSIFESIKNKWIDIAHWDSSESKFALNKIKFERLIEEKVSLSQPSLLGRKSDLQDDNSTLLLSEGNFELIKDSILAYAFKAHQIDQLPAQVEVIMKEQVKSNFIKRFLKRDLKSNRKIDYGIKFKISNDILNFSGMVKSNFEEKNLVIQIITTRNRIMKEIWLHGASEPVAPKNLLSENYYEVF